MNQKKPKEEQHYLNDWEDQERDLEKYTQEYEQHRRKRERRDEYKKLIAKLAKETGMPALNWRKEYSSGEPGNANEIYAHYKTRLTYQEAEAKDLEGRLPFHIDRTQSELDEEEDMIRKNQMAEKERRRKCEIERIEKSWGSVAKYQQAQQLAEECRNNPNNPDRHEMGMD